ncbi:MAG: DUF2089 domain-containing protein [Chthonomonas sp.]|nr:DUF2089 domain-containing protein [Chthonomonas sp.]
MKSNPMHRLPAYDPISGQPLIVTELTSEESGISLRGRFAVPRFAKLTDEQSHFLETFLRCRGVLSSVEKEMGLSYPTVRNRLDQLLSALDLPPAPEPKEDIEGKRRILDQLESGEISIDEAKARIRETR